MGTSVKMLGGGTCDGLVSHPGGSSNTPSRQLHATETRILVSSDSVGEFGPSAPIFVYVNYFW